MICEVEDVILCKKMYYSRSGDICIVLDTLDNLHDDDKLLHDAAAAAVVGYHHDISFGSYCLDSTGGDEHYYW